MNHYADIVMIKILRKIIPEKFLVRFLTWILNGDDKFCEQFGFHSMDLDTRIDLCRTMAKYDITLKSKRIVDNGWIVEYLKKLESPTTKEVK